MNQHILYDDPLEVDSLDF